MYRSTVRRLQLFELHEMPWFPALWRDLVTDFLSFFFRVFKPYACSAPLLAEGLDGAASDRIVDLCSGAGAPVLSLIDNRRIAPSTVTLTDLFPNVTAFRAAVAAGGGVVASVETPVDATDVPPALKGFRTLFTAFHHFPPGQAERVLANAQRNGEGIAIFEFTERNLWLWTVPVLLIPLMVAVCTPLIRPFSWHRLLWTYVIPVVPVVAMWDGLVSNLRTYSPAELRTLADALHGSAYRWRSGRVRSIGLSRVTYLVGWPDPVSPPH
ncbi:MAG: hypothetical protein E4H44_02030 [Candidatus Aminicenantes bacterium]|nr:MAG: hypothetical protein E4H44_02030 [Candidatus Aminicenantes bacterium]